MNILMLNAMVFAIIWDMFHGRISLNSVLLLLLVNFASRFKLELVSFVLLWLPKFQFNWWFFYFSVHCDQQKNNIYLQHCFLSIDTERDFWYHIVVSRLFWWQKSSFSLVRSSFSLVDKTYLWQTKKVTKKSFLVRTYQGKVTQDDNSL